MALSRRIFISTCAAAATAALTVAGTASANHTPENSCRGGAAYASSGAKPREAEFQGGGGVMGPVKLTVGEPVQGKRLHGDQTYYVPRGARVRVTIKKTTYRLPGGSVFIPSCAFEGTPQELRLLRGKAVVAGPSVRNRPSSTLTTPEASFLPLPGRPRYTVTRTVTGSVHKTRSTVKTGRGAGTVFVNVIGPNSRDVPCRAGRSVTVYQSGRVKQ